MMIAHRKNVSATIGMPLICLVLTVALIGHDVNAQDALPPQQEQEQQQPVYESIAVANATTNATTDIAPANAIDVAVVCPLPFRAALQPWLEYRSRQGYRLTLVRPDSEQAIIDQLHAIAERGNLRYVVLVGDADPESWDSPDVAARSVPTHYAKAKINRYWGSEPHIATDNLYADLDRDGLPDVAIGRLPVDTAEQLRQLVDRIIRYEIETRPGPWNQRINFVAGVGDFGLLIDMLIEGVARRLLIDQIPDIYSLSMTYGSYRSPYFPGPEAFNSTVIDSLNQGCAYWVYMGHGQPYGLDRIRTANSEHRIFEPIDLPQLSVKQLPPIAFIFACYTGAFDASEDCIAERMVCQPGGPIAALAASRVTMPYAMSIMGSELITALTVDRRATLGDVVLQAKRRMVGPAERTVGDESHAMNTDAETLRGESEAAEIRLQLDTLAEAFRSEHYNPRGERLEHALLFNLLGDPLLRLPQPDTDLAVRLDPMSDSISPGESLTISGSVPVAAVTPVTPVSSSPDRVNTGAHVLVRLEMARDRLPIPRPIRTEKFKQHWQGYAEHFMETHQKSNRRLVSSTITRIGSDGRFHADLKVPETADGEYVMQILAPIPGTNRYQTTSRRIEVNPQP